MEWWQKVTGARVIGDLTSITDLTHDSREAGRQTGFIAVPGVSSDGHRFLEAAIDAGTRVAVVQADREGLWQPLVARCAFVVVPDTRAAMGPLAAALHGEPSKRLRMIGVTGTDGKTTTSHLIAHVLSATGLDCGYLTSVGFDYGSGFELNRSHMTTVEATTIQRLLGGAVAAGKQSMVVEASSEGLAQHRLDGCEIDAAVFTNLSRDHLDFHKTMEAYLAAKGLLFEMIGRTTLTPALSQGARENRAKSFPQMAVINGDDPSLAYLRGITSAPVLTYGRDAGDDLRIGDVTAAEAGLRFEISYRNEAATAHVPLVGDFNAYNSAAAVGIATSQGVSFADAVAALASFPGVPGRLERIEEGQPFRVYVDIASTPAALENVLAALAPVTRGELWVMFGAAGGRDAARREGMGAVASRLADRIVLTNEDPRDEDPDAIIEAIAKALKAGGRVEGRDFVRIPDRAAAIAYVVGQARRGDTVLLAGKATETSMVFGETQVPWDERAVVRELLRGL